jgi:hypothetical protein
MQTICDAHRAGFHQAGHLIAHVIDHDKVCAHPVAGGSPHPVLQDHRQCKMLVQHSQRLLSGFFRRGVPHGRHGVQILFSGAAGALCGLREAKAAPKRCVGG